MIRVFRSRNDCELELTAGTIDRSWSSWPIEKTVEKLGTEITKDLVSCT